MTFKERFILNFIKDDRWHYLTDGLIVTLEVTFFAVLIGILIGVIVAGIRSTYDKLAGRTRSRLGKLVLGFFNTIANIYLTVIRGTPVTVQLMIAYYIIFISSNNKVMVAVLAFGFNSGAYVAEIVRSGIMSIDEGQFEAGRSLGFSYAKTMWYFILPQAFRNILPALGNEFIVLLKETSISGYIGIVDLTRGGDYIRSRTYEAFLPLIAVAVIYLILVMLLSTLVSRMEQRLKKSND